MRIPDILTTLLDHGLIDDVLRPLMSGKEAQIYLVSSGGEERVAKIYKDAQNRSFQNRADYTEGRKVRNTRDQRAMNNRSRHGKAQNESAWKSAEVDMIYRLRGAGVRVPTPFHFIDDVLIMELVKDAEGNPAPRLGDLTFEPEQATEIFHHVLGEVVRMLCAGVVHGDLSDFNVLMAADGPVVIDFPQAVDASSNQNARKLLLRDVDNLHRFHAKFAPLVPALPYGQEMWDLYQRNHLTPDTRLTGKVRVSQKAVRTDDVLSLIAEAEREEQRRREGLARALRPHLYNKSGGARRPDERTGATPQQSGDRAPGAGRGQGRAEQPRVQRPAGSTPHASERRPHGQHAPQGAQQPRDGRSNQPRDVRAGQPRDGRPHQARDGRAEQPRDGRAEQPRDGRSNQAPGSRWNQPREGRASQPRDGRAEQPRDGRSNQAPESRWNQPRESRWNQPRESHANQPRDGRGFEGNRAAAPQGRAPQGRAPQDERARAERPEPQLRDQKGRHDRGFAIVEQASRASVEGRQDAEPRSQDSRAYGGARRSDDKPRDAGADGRTNESRGTRRTYRGDGSR